MPSPTATKPETGRRYRATVRTRLALTYSALLTGAGIIMLTIVYVFMRFVPTYDLQPGESTAAEEAMTMAPPNVPIDPEQGESAAAITEPASSIRVTSTEEMLNLLLAISIVVLVVLAIAGIAVGWAVAGRMLRPLQHINQAMDQAARGDLKHRINLTGPQDEISILAANFDTMLTQLEGSFTATKRFAANASHELLTPLATTRAMLDLAIARRSDPAERAEFERLRVMNERSIETAQALLKLAELESAPHAVGEKKPVDLVAAIESETRLCADEAAMRGVTITSALQPAMVEGDPVLIRQLVANLLLNAVRHNLPTEGAVSISTEAIDSGTRVRLVIENDGARLVEGEIASLTEPFTRAAGRSSVSSAKGHGLGLSIVAAIVRRSGGTIELGARPGGGLRVVVSLPLASP